LADLYPSPCEDWIDPRSILGVIVVLHAEIGEATCGGRSHRELLEDSIFFYNATFRPPGPQSRYGKFIEIPLPLLESPDWPLPDMSTSEAFRAKLWKDFQGSMRPSTGSKRTHLSWFLPIGVFVDLFSVAQGDMRKTAHMFVFNRVSQDLSNSLMDQGWDSKIMNGPDVIKTTVNHESLSFRYHINRLTLYANFVYNRERLVSSNTWIALDQYEPQIPVTLHC